MLAELNGMSFHICLSHTGSRGQSASIVDEAFLLDPMQVGVLGPDCVIDLIEHYSGLRADDDLREQVRQQMNIHLRAA